MKIFITGAGGTVGTAFVKYLSPNHHVVGVDRNEENVARLKREYPDVDIRVGDFGDASFVQGGVDLLIHLAAMKHVDLCEFNPNECVSNNIVKVQRLFKNAHDNKVDILFMSTDKAVEPISMYGYSKALGEAMAVDYGGAFMRSGNIIASSGSVANIWEKAIQNKQPLKITHKDMKRYFIDVDNFVQRAWAEYMLGKKIIIPEMDRCVFLVSLAEEVLLKYGYLDLEDYPYGVEYTGIRAGEKLEEKLR